MDNLQKILHINSVVNISKGRAGQGSGLGWAVLAELQWKDLIAHAVTISAPVSLTLKKTSIVVPYNIHC